MKKEFKMGLATGSLIIIILFIIIGIQQKESIPPNYCLARFMEWCSICMQSDWEDIDWGDDEFFPDEINLCMEGYDERFPLPKEEMSCWYIRDFCEEYLDLE